MDWNIFWTTFVVLFLAELGDKTQLAVITLTASSQRPWTVFVSSAIALAIVCGLGVMFGQTVTAFISPLWLSRISGTAFIAAGIFLLFR